MADQQPIVSGMAGRYAVALFELARDEKSIDPVKADLDQAWRDYCGWRVNYDAVLIQLCGLVMAPPAKWSSDRPQVDNRHPKVFHKPRRRVNR